MGRPAHSEPQLPEPFTESLAELVAWLRGPPARSQALLAIACGVSQPLLSHYLSRRLRPNPDSEVAVLLQLATGGQVTALGWLTSDEREERRRRRADASAFARAIATGRRVVITMKAVTAPAHGDVSHRIANSRGSSREKDVKAGAAPGGAPCGLGCHSHVPTDAAEQSHPGDVSQRADEASSRTARP